MVRPDGDRRVYFLVGHDLGSHDHHYCWRLLLLSRSADPTVAQLGSARNRLRAETKGNVEAADEAGLNAAFLAHGGELFGFARRSLADNGLAEEAVQETFMRAWRSRHRFDPTLGSLRSWLFAIERRAVIDLAHKRTLNDTDQLVQDPAAVDGQAERAMLGWQVEEALRRLRPEHRAVVHDIYFRNLPGREVAARLGIPEGTVRSRLFYALRSLRLVLEEMGWEQ